MRLHVESAAFVLFIALHGALPAAEAGQASQSASPTLLTATSACKTDDPSATVNDSSNRPSHEIFNELSKLHSGDHLSIRTFDGKHCRARFVALFAGVLDARGGDQAARVALTDVRLMHRDRTFWGNVKETGAGGARAIGRGLGTACASLAGDGGMAVCGAIGAGLGAGFGAGIGMLRNLFERPKRVYERSGTTSRSIRSGASDGA